MGNRIARTIVSTIPPMNTTISGSIKLIRVPSVISSSRSWLVAERSSMVSSSPLASPLATMCTIIGGKRPLSRNARFKLAPSCTCSDTASLSSRSTRLVNTCPAIRRDSSRGTPLAIRILSVEAKRAVSIEINTRDTPGIRSSALCQRFLRPGSRNKCRSIKNSAHTPSTSQRPYC